MGVWALFIIINNTRYCTVALLILYCPSLPCISYKIEMYPVIFNNRLSFSLDTHSEEILDTNTVISTRVILYG